VTGHTVTVHQDWQTAYQTVKALAKQNDMILFTGSLYFVSEVRANL